MQNKYLPNRTLMFIAGWLLLPVALLAQPTQTIRGRVVDKESKFPLVGATVLVSDIQKGMVTDTAGTYRLTGVPVGRHSLKVTLVGYKDALLNDIEVDAGREKIVDIELEEDIRQLTAVTIKAQRTGEARNEMAVVSARQFSVEETNRYAGSRGEPSRMASNFAGVQGADDALWSGQGFGAQVMVMQAESVLTLDGVELRRMGQAGRIGRTI